MQALNALPSLIKASAMDAGARSMRAGGRDAWNEDDADAAAAEYSRLVIGCYAAEGDDPSDGSWAYIRFQTACSLERAGVLKLTTKPAEFARLIEDALGI